MFLFAVQNFVLLVIWAVFLALKLWAFVDCLRRPPQMFPAVERQSKTLWLVLTGVAALTGLIFDPIGLIGIAGVVVALVYLFEVVPRIQQITRR